jgi:hypothetical protein
MVHETVARERPVMLRDEKDLSFHTLRRESLMNVRIILTAFFLFTYTSMPDVKVLNFNSKSSLVIKNVIDNGHLVSFSDDQIC